MATTCVHYQQVLFSAIHVEVGDDNDGGVGISELQVHSDLDIEMLTGASLPAPLNAGPTAKFVLATSAPVWS